MEKDIQKNDDYKELLDSMGDDINVNAQKMANFLIKKGDDENTLMQKLNICKALRDYCDLDNNLYKKYEELLIDIDMQFYQFFCKKFKKLMNQKNYENALYWVNKAVCYYNLPQDAISFDSLSDYFLFSYLTVNFSIENCVSVEPYVYYYFALVCVEIGDKEKAVECIKRTLKCSPMNFMFHAKALQIFSNYGLWDDVKLTLFQAGTIAKTYTELGAVQYFWAKYFYATGKYSLCKVCVNMAMQKDINVKLKDEMLHIVNEIDNSNIIAVDFLGDYTKLLVDYGVPMKKSLHLFVAGLMVYKQCLDAKNVNSEIEIDIIRLLYSFGLDDFVKEFKKKVQSGKEFLVKSKDFTYVFLDKKWKIDLPDDLKNDPNFIVVGTNNNNYFGLCYYDKESYKSGFVPDKNFAKCVKRQEFTTIDGKNVKYAIFESKQEKGYDFVCEFDLSDKFVGTINAFTCLDYDAFRREMLEIVSNTGVISE